MKHAAANAVPSTRCSASACELTSIATASAPRVRSVARQRWSSVASGVVKGSGVTSPPNRTPSVPITPGRRPAAASTASRKNVVVVFPLVPVMPSTGSARDGSPWNRAATGPIDRRTDRTLAWGTAGATTRSTMSATAPRSTATAANSWPSTCRPGMQQNNAPGCVARLSWVTSDTSVAVA